ncbi:MAG: hypothetical protein H6625_04845 [Bdellovibrionaceae bacterium]|nr:hypothetical protein [Pseudobdellovibrionaceae bacterium]
MSADQVRSKNAKNRQFKIISLTVVSGFFILSLFQNCAEHEGLGGAGSLGSANCSPYLKAAFDSTVYSFAVTNCNNCHATGGPGKGKFADADSSLAWNDFSVISNVGTKFYNNSISTSHAPGISGPQLEASASIVKQSLTDAENSCLQSGGGIPGVSVVTTPKQINLAVGDPKKTISWILNSEIDPVQNTGGAIFYIDIQATSANYYVVSKPRIRTLTEDIHIIGVQIIINGQLYELATLFQGIDKVVLAGTGEETADGILNEGAVIISAQVSASDMLVIGFDELNIGAPEEKLGN